jgi:phosphatidylserine/phosphatidylglycerophosphate/cardiolipin synthase-like enzyme
MMPSPLISAIVHACADAPKAAIEKACALLSDSNTDAQAALPMLTGILAKETLTRLKRGLKASSTTARELALAMLSTSAGIEAGRASPDMQLVWTGPDTPEASPRDTLPQMLEMIGRAESSILLVTFAAFKATAIMEALKAAAGRGVKLKIIVESADDSAGQLSHDAWKAFPKAFIKSGCVWFWPIAKRPKNPKGMPGKLHAKCLVIDNRESLVSSANLTDDAMERNIEVGIRCANSSMASQLRAKFDALIEEGQLISVYPSQ